MIKYIIYFAIISLTFSNCKAKKESMNSNSSAQVLDSNTYRLVVCFKSWGEGIDRKKEEELVKFIENKKLAFQTKRWGREGEINYGFRLNELKIKEQETFIKEVKKMLESSKTIDIQENSPLKK